MDSPRLRRCADPFSSVPIPSASAREAPLDVAWTVVPHHLPPSAGICPSGIVPLCSQGRVEAFVQDPTRLISTLHGPRHPIVCPLASRYRSSRLRSCLIRRRFGEPRLDAHHARSNTSPVVPRWKTEHVRARTVALLRARSADTPPKCRAGLLPRRGLVRRGYSTSSCPPARRGTSPLMPMFGASKKAQGNRREARRQARKE